MALVSMDKLLGKAHEQAYAVGGFNVFNFETMGAVIEVAEELKSPVILGLPERLFKFVDVDLLGVAMVRAANRSSVPISIHLDHSHSYEGIMRAIRWGFTSVMFDGSTLSYDDNLKKTREIAKIAHTLGISVEGELSGRGEAHLTKDKVAEFVEKTRIDALAIGVGTEYSSKNNETRLNQLRAIKEVAGVPFVLHGFSKEGLTGNSYKPYIEVGVSKINVATDMSSAAAATLKEELKIHPDANYIHLMAEVKKGVKESVRRYMLGFGSYAKI